MGELEELVVCDNNSNDRKLFPRSLIFSCFREAASQFLCFYRPQGSSGTSTRASSMKTLPRPLAMPSTHDGMPPVPCTANCRQ